MTERAHFIAEIRKLKGEIAILQNSLFQANKDTMKQRKRYDDLLQNMKHDENVPVDVHNYIVLNLQPKLK